MKKEFILIAAFILLLLNSHAQIVINEASNRNFTQVSAEDGNNYDWIELYNSGSSDINLAGWRISDSKNIPGEWIFPKSILKSGEHLLIFASGLYSDNMVNVDHWESAVLPTDTFNYLEPVKSTPVTWKSLTYDISDWQTGKAGFGYGDNDDSTRTDSTSSVVYIRRNFNIPDTSLLSDAILHVDYDDGFVAYLNGIEIARDAIAGAPAWNSLASRDHESVMHSGGSPEKFQLNMDLIRTIWQQGDNVLALEVHNRSLTSSDLTLIPFLSFGISDSSSFFKPVPDWFSNSSRTQLHTNFKIDSNGENLYLYTPDSVIVDSLIIPRIPLNSSFGRTPDGDSLSGIFLIATPGQSNNSEQLYTNGYEPSPLFNKEAGFYTTSLDVSISCSSNTVEIRYTTDGSEPTIISTLYNGNPVKISTTKTLKAKSFSKVDKLPGETKTATYFINITHTLPVISITTDNANLYGTSGIFDHWDASWNKPCFIEYFTNEKILAFSQEAGMQIDGGAGGSRSLPQHSVRIEPGNGTFGAGDLNYRLIPDRPQRENYSAFYLRNGSNQHYTLMYKDALQVKAIGKNTYNYYSAHTPIVMYLNGSYFGLYELREKLDADFFARNYLMNNDSLDLLTLSYYKGLKLEALEGSTDQFWADFEYFKTLIPTDSSYLGQVSKILDLENYTDYIIAESWICNTDWPVNNIRVFRNKSTGYRWRYAIQDVELALAPGGWNNASMDHIGFMLGQDPNLPYISYWLGLMKNKEYKYYFINRFADLMNTNYLFSKTGPMEDEMYNLHYPEMQKEFTRWGNSDMTAFRNNHNIIRGQLESRSGYVRKNLQSHFNLTKQIEVTLDVYPAGAGQIKISTITPVDYPWSGIYFSNIPVKIEAIANPGYVFTGWNDHSMIYNLDNPEFTATFLGNAVSFTAYFEASDTTFDGVTIAEVHYKNGIKENSTDWIELFNGGGSDLNLKGWYFTDRDTINKFVFGDGITLEANSRLVVARNISAFSLNYPAVKNYTGSFNYKLGSPEDAVKLYDSTNFLVAAVNYSDIYPWPLNGDEEGKTLELRNPAGNLSDPANWFAGCIGGSPGAAYSACPVMVGTGQPEIERPSLSVYPVPAKDYINISFTLQNSSKNCILKIYNLMGSEVKSVNIGEINSGTNNLTNIDISDTPAGLLILQMQTDNLKANIKIVHLK